MGLDTAMLLASEGAKVAMIGRSRERGEPRAKEIADATGANVQMIVADGTERGSVEAAIDQAAEDFGGLNGLAVTAGTMQTRKTLLELVSEARLQSGTFVSLRFDDPAEPLQLVTLRGCGGAALRRPPGRVGCPCGRRRDA